MSDERRTEEPGEEPSERVSAMQDFARYSGLGVQLFLTIGLFTLGGWWLDSKLGTSPFLLLLGVCVGFGAGFYSILSKVPGTTARGSARKQAPPHDADGDPPHQP